MYVKIHIYYQQLLNTGTSLYSFNDEVSLQYFCYIEAYPVKFYVTLKESTKNLLFHKRTLKLEKLVSFHVFKEHSLDTL